MTPKSWLVNRMVYGMGFATLFNHLILLDQDVCTKLLEGKIISIHHIILIKNTLIDCMHHH